MKSYKFENEFEIENVCMLHPKTVTKKGYENSPWIANKNAYELGL